MNNLLPAKYYELQFMVTLPYESEFGWSMEEKIEMIDKIFRYLAARNIHVRFSDRIVDDIKDWTRPEGATWREVQVGKLYGNMIVINPRNIDFLSVLLTIAHIYGHLVQREDQPKYDPITRFVYWPKPLKLDEVQARYEQDRPGREYWADFLDFEKEAFGYGKFALKQAGVEITPLLDQAIQAYIEADFKELKRWCVSEPNKDGGDFFGEFERTFQHNKGNYPTLPEIPVEIEVRPDPTGSLMVVRT